MTPATGAAPAPAPDLPWGEVIAASGPVEALRSLGTAVTELARPRAAGAVLAELAGLAAELARVAAGRSSLVPQRGDRRFDDPAWQANPVYRRLMQAYLAESRALTRLPDQLPLPGHSRARAEFAASLVTDALAPTNTLPGNPAALKRAAATRGRSLLRGSRHLLDDVLHNGGMPAQVDRNAFRVGGNLAVSPGAVVHRSDVSSSSSTSRPPPRAHQAAAAHPAADQQVLRHGHRPRPQLHRVRGRARDQAIRGELARPTRHQRQWNLDTYAAAALEADRLR